MEAALIGPSGRTSLGPTGITLGRQPDNALVVNDAKASSHHAEIRPNGDSYTITDLRSTNGTFVNEQRLPPQVPQPLRNGDKIRIGDLTFTYEVTGVAPIAPTVYGGPAQNDAPGYLPTVAAAPPDAGNQPGYLPTVAAQSSIPPAVPSPGPSPYPQTPNAPVYPPAGSFMPYTEYQQGAQPNAQAYQQPPPPPAYPAYGAPGQPAFYPQAAPPAPRSRKTLWIILGIVGGVLLLGVVLCAVLVAVNVSTPSKTLDAFCNAVNSKNYQTAYDQLSSFRKTQISESEFATGFAQFSSCSFSSPNQSGSSASTTMAFVASASGQTVSAPADMVQENGTWKISAINFPSS